MPERPPGMYLLCAFFGLVGFATVTNALSLMPARHEIPASQPESVHLFVTWAPVFLVLVGALGMFVAAKLWSAEPVGRTAGFVWLGLWLVQHVLVFAWGRTGPEVIRDASPGLGGMFLRVLVIAAVFAYLRTVAPTYLKDPSPDAPSSAP